MAHTTDCEIAEELYQVNFQGRHCTDEPATSRGLSSVIYPSAWEAVARRREMVGRPWGVRNYMWKGPGVWSISLPMSMLNSPSKTVVKPNHLMWSPSNIWRGETLDPALHTKSPTQPWEIVFQAGQGPFLSQRIPKRIVCSEKERRTQGKINWPIILIQTVMSTRPTQPWRQEKRHIVEFELFSIWNHHSALPVQAFYPSFQLLRLIFFFILSSSYYCALWSWTMRAHTARMMFKKQNKNDV